MDTAAMRALATLLLLSVATAAPAPAEVPSSPEASAPASTTSRTSTTVTSSSTPPPSPPGSKNPFVEMADKFIEEMLLQSSLEGNLTGQVTEDPEEVFDRLMNEVFFKPATTARPQSDASAQKPDQQGVSPQILSGDRIGEVAPSTSEIDTLIDEVFRPTTDSAPQTSEGHAHQSQPSTVAPVDAPAHGGGGPMHCKCPPSVKNPHNEACECMAFHECSGPRPTKNGKPYFPGPIPGDTCPGFYTLCCLRARPTNTTRRTSSSSSAKRPAISSSSAQFPVKRTRQVRQVQEGESLDSAGGDDAVLSNESQAEPAAGFGAVGDVISQVPDSTSAAGGEDSDAPTAGLEGGILPAPETNSTLRMPCDCPPSAENPDNLPCECRHFSECSGPEVPLGEDGMPDFPGPIPGDTCPGFFTVCCVPNESNIASLVRSSAPKKSS